MSLDEVNITTLSTNETAQCNTTTSHPIVDGRASIQSHTFVESSFCRIKRYKAPKSACSRDEVSNMR